MLLFNKEVNEENVIPTQNAIGTQSHTYLHVWYL